MDSSTSFSAMVTSFSAMVSLNGIIGTHDEALVILVVCLLILKLQQYSGTKADNGTPIPEMQNAQRPIQEMENMQSTAQVTSTSKCPSVAPAMDIFEQVGLKPLADSDASTTDSGASLADSDSETNDILETEECELSPWCEEDSELDRARLSGGDFCDYQALNKKELPNKGNKQLWTQPISKKANKEVQKFLSDVWKQTRFPHPDLANQLHKMLTSSNIALSPETYQILIRIAVDGGCLSLATELSFEMERLTGAMLSQSMHDGMLEMHLMPDICAMESLSLTEELETIQEEGESIEEEEVMPDMCVIENLPGRAGTLKGEMIANLTKHPWSCHPSNDPSLQQKHQIYVGNQNKVYCLSMMGDTSPKLKQYELIWNGTTFIRGKGVKSPEKGVKSAITLNSTCADIKDGVVVWTKDDSTGHSWQWHASR
eukprot:gnl/MRDRNA2_/MRDRNA2_83857_c1_seq8.p1 gnl/MRDRNA2_/MRDRNA2_83857_c1~~gnl/MRDRNA2_/MRDRNA2_83857_c1_seq8.p1  ORF type:complete len:429 (+),score=95.84 gnl/MRDRNA2_/MRDRNA2_83857_c1_seq8:117-1403(+)